MPASNLSLAKIAPSRSLRHALWITIPKTLGERPRRPLPEEIGPLLSLPQIERNGQEYPDPTGQSTLSPNKYAALILEE